jgi:hypothetical protein
MADQSGHPLANVRVTFAGKGAQIYASTVKTNSTGIASILAAPTLTGNVSVTATVVGTSKSLVFNEIGANPPAM